MLFNRKANWIWPARGSREYNTFACFRRAFQSRGNEKSARLLITADSRYEVFVNGTWLGHGPVRSWHSPWPVDEYDIRHLLVAGKNVVAVLVQHFGISTFQYLHAEPGLIAQVEIGSQKIVTDKSWRAIVHEGYNWPVPRISCQQAWEEQFDARVSPGAPQEWGTIDFKDARWPAAKVTRKLGDGPHKKFELRTLPALTRENVEPIAVRAIEAVETADYTWTINPRELVNFDDRSANHIRARMLLVTFIDSNRAQDVQIHPPHIRPIANWKLNGQQLEFDDKSLQKTDTGVAHAKLKKGRNTLMCKLPESEHLFWATLNIHTQKPVKFSPWRAMGPFEGARDHVFDTILIGPKKIEPRATADRFAELWERGEVTKGDLGESFCHVLSRDMVTTSDAYALCASERVVEKTEVKTAQPQALIRDNADWTTVSPAPNDVRFLFDFGEEIVGFHEFEIDAPEGTIVDFHNFEFIQRDGRMNLNEGMNNSFRYICKGGLQRYRTFVRRGFRYSWMSLRNFKKPVRVRFVRVIQSTYPPAGAGDFQCSDSVLEEIWNVGVRSVRCCSEDTYTDCPTYEQTFWVGDGRNEALVDLIANGDARLSGHCLRIAGRSLDRSPIVESQVPSGWQNLLPTWSWLWMRWVQEHFELTGDEKFAREMLTFVDRNVRGMRAAINDRGLFEMFAWNLFDWAPMDTPAGGIVTHINCQAVQGLRQCADLATRVGNSKLAREWTQLADEMTEAINRHLWSAAKDAYVDCIRADGSLSPVFSQQTATAAYISGVASGGRADRCREIVHNPPADFVKAGSPFFMFFLLEALVREKRFDALVDTIRNYWGKQIDAGATTFWEMYHEGAPRLTRSHCHGWSAAPVVFLSQHVLGVQPLEPGYARVLIAPKPSNIAWAQGRVPTPHGVVECSWKVEGKRFSLSVDAPKKTPMKIELPFDGEVEVLEGSLSGPRVKLVVKSKGSRTG